MTDAAPFDVFFSYAWATDTGSPMLRDWCRTVADAIGRRLATRFNARQPFFSAYLDRDVARTGQDLPEVLEAAVRRSSVFVAMVSDYYDSPYCHSEIDWFCRRLREAGLKPEEHLCILRVQASSRNWWPQELTGANGQPLLYIDFCDQHGDPLEATQLDMKAGTPELADAIARAVVVIGDKVSAIRTREDVQRKFREAQRPPDRPIVYFEAEELDDDRWRRWASLLEEAPSIVQPGPVAATAPASAAEFDGCDGLVMLRARGSDEIGPRIRQAYRQRRKLWSQDKAELLPWVLLDELETPPAMGEKLAMPRVQLHEGWVADVRRALWG